MSDYDPLENARKSYDVAIDAMREKLASFRCEKIGDAVLYLGDCKEILSSWPECFRFNAAVTSPPYGDIRAYGGHEKPDLLAVISAMSKRLEAGGVIVWNTADQTVNGSETGESFRHALHAIDCGLRLHDTMIYCKEGVTFPDSNRYHPAFEYMFIFSSGAPKHFNGLKDWANKSRGRILSGTSRQKDGTTSRFNNVGQEVPTCGLRRNWWPIANPYTGETEGHPAPMPYSMAHDHLETWTTPGETILDPFMGSGTTGVACAKLGRKFIGIELEPKYFDIACKRIEEAWKQPRLFEEPREKVEQAAFDLGDQPKGKAR